MACRFLFMCIAVVIFASLQIGESLKCYHCVSAPGGECANPTNNTSFIKDCDNSTNADQVCYVRNITLPSAIEIGRGCIARSECKSFEHSAANTTCISCEKDLCNSSPVVAPSMFFMLSIISAIMVKLYL